MTYATIADALTAMEKVFRDVWAGKACDYPNTKFDIKDVADNATWARFRVQHNERAQRTLAGNDGKRRYGATGNIIIVIFVPLNTGVIGAYNAAEPVLKAYENAALSAWFRNVRVIEAAEGEAQVINWYPLTIIADFDYEQFN